MGHTVLTLSSRLSEDYITRLLEKSQADVVVHDRPFLRPAKHVRTFLLAGEEQLMASHKRPEMEVVCDPSVIRGDDVLFINHSSGSTSLPKLLPITNDIWMTRMRQFSQQYRDDRREWAASALYNTLGFVMLCRSLMKTACAFFENDRTHLTPAGALAFLDEAKPHDLHLTPWTLGVLASTQKGIEALKTCDRVRTFGAVCPDELGNMLTSEGIYLTNGYGMTETGPVMGSVFRPVGDDEWDWLVPVPSLKEWLDMHALGTSDGLHELILLPGFPGLLPTVQAADGSYATGDLFLKHPTKPDRWKIVGRKDDQLKIYQDDRQVLVNAVMYEQKIMSWVGGIVDDVVVFGQGRGKLGVLIFADGAKQGSSKAKRIAEQTWDAIQRQINGKMPVGIGQEMIVVVETKRAALPQTGKFNLIRAQVYMRFKDLIDQAYERPYKSAGDDQASVHTNGRL